MSLSDSFSNSDGVVLHLQVLCLTPVDNESPFQRRHLVSLTLGGGTAREGGDGDGKVLELPTQSVPPLHNSDIGGESETLVPFLSQRPLRRGNWYRFRWSYLVQLGLESAVHLNLHFVLLKSLTPLNPFLLRLR
jgi:hypothetical protein